MVSLSCDERVSRLEDSRSRDWPFRHKTFCSHNLHDILLHPAFVWQRTCLSSGRTNIVDAWVNAQAECRWRYAESHVPVTRLRTEVSTGGKREC